MDDTEDDARYPPKHYKSYNSSQRLKNPVRNASYSRTTPNQYNENDEDDEQEVDDLEEDGEEHGVGINDDDDEDEEEDNDDDEDENEDDQYNYRRTIEEDEDFQRRSKKRKLKTLISDYEFAPRAANLAAGSGRKPAFVGRTSPAEWTEHATFVLLEAWGNRYLELGRKSLRSDDWTEVAEKVSEVSKIERTDTHCRNRLDILKKKYKKEKTKIEEMEIGSSKWVYFKKMDMLMAVSSRQNYGLACGVDSGEYVFMNPKVYLNCSNGLDEMRDSPANSESGEGGEDDDLDGENDEGSSSFRLLADSVQKFGEIYEKIENSKRQQMMELEKMRMDFHRELELQKKQILDRAQAEIEKIRQGDNDDDEDSDASAENLSG